MLQLLKILLGELVALLLDRLCYTFIARLPAEKQIVNVADKTQCGNSYND